MVKGTGFWSTNGTETRVRSALCPPNDEEGLEGRGFGGANGGEASCGVMRMFGADVRLRHDPNQASKEGDIALG